MATTAHSAPSQVAALMDGAAELPTGGAAVTLPPATNRMSCPVVAVSSAATGGVALPGRVALAPPVDWSSAAWGALPPLVQAQDDARLPFEESHLKSTLLLLPHESEHSARRLEQKALSCAASAGDTGLLGCCRLLDCCTGDGDGCGDGDGDGNGTVGDCVSLAQAQVTARDPEFSSHLKSTLDPAGHPAEHAFCLARHSGVSLAALADASAATKASATQVR